MSSVSRASMALEIALFTVVKKLASSLIAAASSLRVSRVSGAPPIKSLIAELISEVISAGVELI